VGFICFGGNWMADLFDKNINTGMNTGVNSSIGINIDISPYINEFKDFLSSKYKPKIDNMISNYPKKRSIYVDYKDLEKYNPDIADKLIDEPEMLIMAANEALSSFMGNLTMTPAIQQFGLRPHVRFVNLPDMGLMIQNISSSMIGKLISVKGVVTKRAEVRHMVKTALYRCSVCDAEYRVDLTKSQPPTVCEACKRKALRLIKEGSEFIDIQRCEMQELLERVKGGAPPARIELWTEEDMVNAVTPGDTVEVVGILKIKQPDMTRNRKKSFIYARYIDVVSVRSLQRDFEEIVITKNDEDKIRELAARPDIFDLLTESVASGIYGHKEVKQALVLQLFGGTRDKKMPGGAPIRDDIHILLIGDPGVSKSRLLQYIAELAPKSIYVSGKSVSSAGLTASAERDELDEGGWTLKAGALVLASGGIASIDEFDKIDPRDRAALHEAMESQTISVAKAGIVARMRAKTAILAAANPKFGRFDINRPIGEQFDIPPTLLSRFDLIFPMIDTMDAKFDSAVADKILYAHKGKDVDELERTEVIDPVLMRKYIAYTRQTLRPRLSEEAMKHIKGFYLELRALGKKQNAVPITARQIEGIIRMAEASAKTRLSEVVELIDAKRATMLTEHMLRSVGMDRETGEFDIDIVATGNPKSKMDKLNTVINIIEELSKSVDEVDIQDVISEAKSYNIQRYLVEQIIRELISKGEIYEPTPGHIEFTDKR